MVNDGINVQSTSINIMESPMTRNHPHKYSDYSSKWWLVVYSEWTTLWLQGIPSTLKVRGSNGLEYAPLPETNATLTLKHLITIQVKVPSHCNATWQQCVPDALQEFATTFLIVPTIVPFNARKQQTIVHTVTMSTLSQVPLQSTTPTWKFTSVHHNNRAKS